MTSPMRPEMHCVRVPKFLLDDWPTIHRLFETLPVWEYQQTWLAHPQRDLRPGKFRAAHWDTALVVYAELWDSDIFNPVLVFNEVAYTRGDAFEMFMRPEGQDAYYELHVTPHNQKLQLRFPSATVFASLRKQGGKAVLPSYTVDHPLFESRTQICPDQGKWHVVAAIPFASVVETEAAARTGRWLFSASRYDYTQGHAKPVISSTSPHKVANFHRQQEWGTLHLNHGS